jgi:hypothetical protein
MLSCKLSITAIFVSFISFGQVQTLENGVVVHPAVGIEGIPVPQTNSLSIQRSISDWNLAECMNALQDIDLKCQELGSAACAEVYGEQRSQIELRIHSLTSN